MTYEEVEELHYITPLANLESICTKGLLSHIGVSGIEFVSVAMAEIQERRGNKRVPNGLMLHDYVNLYLCARNPMMYVIRQRHEEICIVRISPTILRLPGVVISDGNAASNYVRFGAFPEGLNNVSEELVFAEYWTDADYYEGLRRKTAKCAEVLVPHKVAPEFLVGAYVSGTVARDKFTELGIPLIPEINAHIFFNDRR